MRYLHQRRKALGGYLPDRSTRKITTEVPTLQEFHNDATIQGSGDKEWSTTMGFVRLFTKLLRDKRIGRYIVPIVPDESRTFGMEGLFRQIGIYSHVGQLYEPVDSHLVSYYKEAKNGQLLEEGITEAGSMCSFIAAGTAYATHGINMIPFFIYYSMFGFQRIGDLIWAACDTRAKGFMIGGTAGRTTLNGEGLQHQDGHSLLFASAYPTVRPYDPAFAYETTTIILEGLNRLYQQDETAIYYITVENENYHHPPMPEGVAEGIIRGAYRFNSVDLGGARPRVQLLGSGPILRCVLDAQKLLAERYGVSSDVWSVTSYTMLRREALECQRWNMLHPEEEPRRSYVERLFDGAEGPFVAASDYVRNVPEQIAPWVPGGLFTLGTDGFGRSDLRSSLRRFFEVDAQSITVAALYQLALRGKLPRATVAQAIRDLDIDPEKINPMTA